MCLAIGLFEGAIEAVSVVQEKRVPDCALFRAEAVTRVSMLTVT